MEAWREGWKPRGKDGSMEGGMEVWREEWKEGGRDTSLKEDKSMEEVIKALRGCKHAGRDGTWRSKEVFRRWKHKGRNGRREGVEVWREGWMHGRRDRSIAWVIEAWRDRRMEEGLN